LPKTQLFSRTNSYNTLQETAITSPHVPRN
jgi:hypothetical protein